VVAPPFPFPPLPFPFPYILSLPVGGKVRSSEGEVPRLPPTNTTLFVSVTGVYVYSAIEIQIIIIIKERYCLVVYY